MWTTFSQKQQPQPWEDKSRRKWYYVNHLFPETTAPTMGRHNPKPERNLVRTQHYKRGAPSNGQNLRKRLAIQTKTSTTNDSNDNDLTKSDGRINNPHQRQHQPASVHQKKIQIWSNQSSEPPQRRRNQTTPHLRDYWRISSTPKELHL